MLCQNQWNRHKWTIKGGRVLCRRCGNDRNPNAGPVKIQPKRAWVKRPTVILKEAA